MTPKSADDELSPFGRAVVERLHGRSRAWLQQELGVSRSTLYRMLTARRGVTLEDARRVAKILNVLPGMLINVDPDLSEAVDHEDEINVLRENSPSYGELESFVGNLDRIIRTLSTGTSAKLDPRSKLAILNGIEEAARIAGQRLPEDFWELRRAVNEGRA